jgi:hypothetical protein
MFYIAIADSLQREDDFAFYAGRLVLGGELEFLRCSSDLWRPIDYRRQWIAAATALNANAVASAAFVTSVARGKNNLVWWVARRRGNKVVFRNQMLFVRRVTGRVVPEHAHECTGRTVTKHRSRESRPSEWSLTYKEVKRWLRDAT